MTTYPVSPMKIYKLTESQIKEIAFLMWTNAANAYRIYPNQKHTFSDKWEDGFKPMVMEIVNKKS